MELKYDEVNGIAYTYINGVKGTLRPVDAKLIRDLAIQIPMNGTYVETGSYLGCSSIIAGLHARHGVKVYAHDIWTESMKQLEAESGPPPETDDYFFQFYKNVRDNGLERVVIPIRGDSKYTLGIHEDDSIDVAFIDGDHSYEGFLGDMKAIYPKMKPKSGILCHDTSWEGVKKGLDEFCGEYDITPRMFQGTDMCYLVIDKTTENNNNESDA